LRGGWSWDGISDDLLTDTKNPFSDAYSRMVRVHQQMATSRKKGYEDKVLE
jgi:hypothetical protein